MSPRSAFLGVFLVLASPAYAEVEVRAMPGVVVRAPRMEATSSETRVSGAVCRSGFRAGRPRFVRLERLDSAGRVVERGGAELGFVPGYRGGCAPYAVATGPLRDGDSARLHILRRR